MIRVRISSDVIDPALEAAQIEGEGVGAISTFTGLVRGDGELVELLLEHYPVMTDAALTQLAEEAAARWSLSGVVLVHRVGPMRPGERIVFVGTAAPHRGAALEACAYLIDRLKTDAPFWKRETYVDGRQVWVEQRGADLDAASRWNAAR
ncbi:molybdopterin synthase catalytic subunit [Sphingomonas zeicaulis]|uniref:molybdenum cofactor biosynthesis protein MoaE n=1 Tax=Sphingomonas zeicaulis TaxID=1632740 RepID=UPI003D1E09FC